jgi:transcriptional regulator with XRE-family HTH domain
VKTPLLRAWREAKGETQHTLSALSGLTIATISRVENGYPLRPGTAKRLAEALGVEVVDLLENPPIQAKLAGKADAPATGQAVPPSQDTGLPVLLKKALDAQRSDNKKVEQALNRLDASEGTLPQVGIEGFEMLKLGPEFREAGFTDTQVAEFIWPLIRRVVEQEREISQRGVDEAREAAAKAQTILEKIEAEYRKREAALKEITRATEEAEATEEAKERATNNG